MTTHLEEVLKEFDEQFGHLIGNFAVAKPFIKTFIINAHIQYLEGEIERLEAQKNTNIENQMMTSSDQKSGFVKALLLEIFHKQQELLQAKALLK